MRPGQEDRSQSLQWGRRQTSTERAYVSLGALSKTYASMGPPTNVDGEDPLRWKTPRRIFVLQWGRRQTSTERHHDTWRCGIGRGASMGPPTNVDGEAVMDQPGPVFPCASMGPPTNVDGEALQEWSA